MASIHSALSEKPILSGGITLNNLKIMAIAAMVLDHIAFAFIPYGTASAIILNTIGKITGPVMFFSAVEGYHHTKNINRYMSRLAVFAVISWFPFLYFHYGGISSDMSFMRPNVIYTIFLGVSAIRVRRSERLRNPAMKTLIILILVILCVPADWGCTGISIIIALDYFYGNFRHQAFAYCMIVLLDMNVLTLITHPLSLDCFTTTFSTSM